MYISDGLLFISWRHLNISYVKIYYVLWSIEQSFDLEACYS